MNFLGLSFLFALPLIAVPVAIHLYRGRQRDIIPWGAMQFLTAATTKGRSLQRLEELLLMFLRVAAILALVLALARPMLRSTWLGSGAQREVVLLLDNSLSMARTVDDESAHDQMLEKARELVDDLSPSDTVQILLASGGGQWLTAEGVATNDTGKRQLTTLLQDVRPGLGTANLLDSLRTVVNLEPQGDPTARRIVVLTDNQAASWQPTAEGAWWQLGTARETSKLPTTIEVLTCGFENDPLENLAVMKLEASRQLVRPDERIDFSAQLTNVGEDASDETKVEWLLGDEVFDTSTLKSLTPGESTQLSTQLRQQDEGHFAVTCRIQADDQIDLDRESSVVIEVSDQLPILVVHEQAADSSSKSAEDLFAAALGYHDGAPQSVHSVYRPEVVAAEQFADQVLSNYRAIVILGLAELPAETHERLQSFVRGGGGLWVTLGEQVDRDTFNRDWYDDGGGLCPLALDSLVSVPDTNKPEGTIHPPEQDHPATAQLANTTQLDIDEARLSEYWQLTQGEAAQGNQWVLLEAGNGSPLAVENLYGEGRVLIQAFPLDLTWSNLPQLKSYVVMIYDWLDYLTAPVMSRYNLEPGHAILAHLPTESELTTAKLTTPGGQEVVLSTEASDANGLVRYSQTQLPGLYRVTFDTGAEVVRLPFYVARDSNESSWQPLADDEQAQLAELAGLQFEGAPAETAAAAAESQPRTEPLWGALLLTLLALLVGEQLLSHWLTRQRSGAAVTIP